MSFNSPPQSSVEQVARAWLAASPLARQAFHRVSPGLTAVLEKMVAEMSPEPAMGASLPKPVGSILATLKLAYADGQEEDLGNVRIPLYRVEGSKNPNNFRLSADQEEIRSSVAALYGRGL